MVGVAQSAERLVVVQKVAGSIPVAHPTWVRFDPATKGLPLVAGSSWPFFTSADQLSVGMETGGAQPVVRVAVADPHVVVLVDVDRLEQRLFEEPTVRIVGVLVDVGGAG